VPEKLELLSKFNELMNEDLPKVLEGGETEVVFPLYKTDWVRIMLVRSIQVDRSVVLDVEVSLPSRSSSYHETPISHINDSSSSRKLLETMKEHIQYILALETSGFSVDLVGDGCLMVAYKSFPETPDAETFRLLQPPSV